MSKSTPVVTTPREPEIIGTFPVSATQQRCWFLDQINPGNPALNVAVRWEIQGKFQAATIEQAFRKVIERHEILRTCFVEDDGEPVQKAVDAVDFRLSTVDILNNSDDYETRIEAIAHENAEKPFDLTKPGLIRGTLVRFAKDRAILLIVAHQSCFDGFSIRVLGNEIGKIAQSIDEGTEPDLPDLPLQYGDYAMWQKEFHGCGVLDEERAFWKQQLEGAPYFEVEPDFPRPASRKTSADMAHLTLPPSFGDKLEAMAKKYEVSTFVFGCAVFSAALHRYTNRPEVLFGTQIAGRNDVDLEALIGVFINNLVLRFNTDPGTKFSDLLQQSKSVVQNALSHQNLPFNKLVEMINPVRDASRTPLISVNMNLQRSFMKDMEYGAFKLLSAPSHSPGAVYDLNLGVVGRPSGWRCSMEYNTSLFSAETAMEILQLFRTTFEFVLDNPNALLSDILITEEHAEKRDKEHKFIDRVRGLLESSDLVCEAVVTTGSEGVYAYVTPNPESFHPLENLPQSLLEYLAGEMPVEDMPSGVSVLADFPRDGNGAVVQARLPKPRPITVTQAKPAARTHEPEVEAKLRVIWQDILKVDDISAHSGFFALGGHSLLAVRMLARVRDQFGVSLGIAAVYEHPTLTELGSVIAGRLGGGAQEEENWRILPLEKSGSGVPLIAINNAATALAICEGFEQQRPSTCVRLFDGTRGIDQSERTFEEIAEEYAKVVREAQPQGPYMLFGICVHGNVALETARILHNQGEEIACVVVKDVWEPHFIENMFKSRKLTRADRAHTLKRKFKRYRDGNMSFAAFLGSYRLVRMTGILQIAQAVGLIDRVKRSDLEAEQERFVDYLTLARDHYKPDMLDFPVLHVVTEDVPDVPGFRPSIGWDHYVTKGNLKNVEIPEVLVHRGKKIGTDQVAKELEIFLSRD